ncbi:D-alanyl-D-alanine carboxypeptidase/D-alanyl-D-alanine endopeptidase [Nocardioides mangrovi]|uniref:D-alanyl-D-alanine carboxypeptidase/D-alanyl-D-alanine-endopeptidase n=1 Tax=Nocardioides mangrovi TaxID=2874580 RepID=A0ABS7UDZ3_9ACTN|nr:D-alanyl-D-alanine carboxypeptidase/D-alanyl-D-alanine-endopeptidase [Nocardioides mangrovi]MBZ5739219.1 D-alanyl-D-alanine carboxypeptidase/D-alanyl-D-alanine-endopeptidase [Nocardioides mangrovi]
MGRRDAHHGSRLAFWLPVVLVLAILAAAGTTYWLGRDDTPEADTPAEVPPPAGLDLPTIGDPAAVADPATGTPAPHRVRRALAPLLTDDDLGGHVLATVAGLDGTLLYSDGTGEAVPASTLKLLTTTAALEVLGPDHTFATTVVADGARRVVLVGGGDPLLEAGDLTTLARKTAQALPAGARVKVGFDTSLFSGPDVSPHWPASYISEGVVAPIQPLWIDEGRTEAGYGRVADPAATAADRFAAALAKAGVRTTGDPAPATAPAGAAELARVDSEPLDRIVEHTLETSDNEAAEVLARQVGIATSGTGSFAAGARAVVDTLDDLGVPTDGARVYDGSGLSRDDRVDPDTLTAVLETASSDDHPELRSVITGLPVAGFTGSLTERFTEARDDQGRGLVRAKTGTLTGVSSLAGIVTDRTGAPMVFALMADDIDVLDTLDARAALDAATSALAACRCAATGTVGP